VHFFLFFIDEDSIIPKVKKKKKDTNKSANSLRDENEARQKNETCDTPTHPKRKRVSHKHVLGSNVTTDVTSSSVTDKEAEDRKSLLESWITDYLEMTSSCIQTVSLPERGKNLSVSHIMGLAAKHTRLP